jgi:hypothetical protein
MFWVGREEKSAFWTCGGVDIVDLIVLLFRRWFPKSRLKCVEGFG